MGVASGAVAGVATAPAYRVAIARGDAGADDADAALPLPLVVGDPIGGRVPDRPIVLRVAVRPAPDAVPTVAWSATGKASLSERAGASMFFSAPPGGVFLDRGRTVGPFAITARIGAPVDRMITVPAYGYPNGFAVCSGGEGMTFDAAGRPQQASRPEDADVYVTGPGGEHAQLFSGCSGAFERDDEPYTVHVPGGAVAASFSTSDLPRVSVRDLRPPLRTSFPADELGSVLLFRTRDGRVAKMGPNFGTGRGIAGPALVAAAGAEFADTTFARTARAIERPFGHAPDAPVRFAPSIDFADGSTGPYSHARALEYALPYHVRTPFFQPQPDLRVVIAPVPYRSPDVAWKATGDAAGLSMRANVPNVAHVEPGDHPGAVTIAATVGPPVRRTITRELDAYDSLVVFANGSPAGVRFTTHGFTDAPDTSKADVFISPDDVLHVPMGGVMLTDGDDPRRRVPQGGAAGPPFTDLTAAAWRADRTTLDLAAWRTVVGPCYRDESPGIERLDATCTTMHTDVLLFKTRDGRFVKWHIVDANGTTIMGGPYEVLPR